MIQKKGFISVFFKCFDKKMNNTKKCTEKKNKNYGIKETKEKKIKR